MFEENQQKIFKLQYEPINMGEIGGEYGRILLDNNTSFVVGSIKSNNKKKGLSCKLVNERKSKTWIDKQGNEHYETFCEIHPHVKVTNTLFKDGGGEGMPCRICTRTYL